MNRNLIVISTIFNDSTRGYLDTFGFSPNGKAVRAVSRPRGFCEDILTLSPVDCFKVELVLVDEATELSPEEGKKLREIAAAKGGAWLGVHEINKAGKVIKALEGYLQQPLLPFHHNEGRAYEFLLELSRSWKHEDDQSFSRLQEEFAQHFQIDIRLEIVLELLNHYTKPEDYQCLLDGEPPRSITESAIQDFLKNNEAVLEALQALSSAERPDKFREAHQEFERTLWNIYLSPSQ